MPVRMPKRTSILRKRDMMDVDEIEASDELDALIEVNLFGGTCARCQKQPAAWINRGVVYCSEDCYERIGDFALDDYSERRQRYSMSIEAAWKIVEKLRERGLYLIINDTMSQYRARFWDQTWNIDDWVRSPDHLTVWAETAPLAIARAALNAAAQTTADK
jgi:hypothetical protein